MLTVNKKFRNFISLVLVVFLLLTPMVSYATTTADSDTTDDTTASDTSTTTTTTKTTTTAVAKDAVTGSTLTREQALANAIVADHADEIKGHTYVCSNDEYELYLKKDNLSIIIRDKKSGAIMESTVSSDEAKAKGLNDVWAGFAESGISIDFIDDTKDPVKMGVMGTNPEVTVNDNGFTAKVNYSSVGISFEVQVTLDNDGLHVEIPNDTVVESVDKKYIGSIYCYPFLGSTYLGERDGYMIIPDGNGAIINLDNNKKRFSTGFSDKVYGTDIGIDLPFQTTMFNEKNTVNDAESIVMPVYGMVHSDSKMAVLGVIEKGVYNSSIVASPNGANIDYNWITSRFIFREIYEKPTSLAASTTIRTTQKNNNVGDMKITYLFTSGDAADYAGLAVKYREKLIKDGTLSKKDNSFNIRLDFLGTEKENFLLFKRTVTMTTVDNIKEIYKELKKDDVTDILSVYKGWQKGGIQSLPITSYKADKAIGGTEELTALIKDLKESSINFYLDQDALRINPDTANATFNSIKKIDKRLYQENNYGVVFDYFNFLAPSYTNKYLKSTSKDYKDNGIENLAISGISNNLFQYTFESKTYTREETANSYLKTLSGLDEDYNLILDAPLSYLWNYTDAFLDMPVSTSKYVYTDAEIPFLAIVLKGSIPMYSEYTNFEANKTEFFLKLIEMGVFPSFYLTYEDPAELQYTNSADIYTSQFKSYKESIVKYYSELKAVNEKIGDAYIVDHQTLDSGVNVTTYDNGVKVYVNYSDEAVTVDGLTIEGLSYKVGEAE